MSSTSGTILQDNSIDVKALAGLIIELNIARRNFKSYPKGHPVIEGAFQKVISHYNTLLQSREELAIGVAKDTLMYGTAILEKNNLVYRDFARVLFEHSIGVLTMRKGLSTKELENFNIILGLKREEINRHGGIEALWGKAQITSLAITAIRYDLFGMSDQEDEESELPDTSSEGIWERFTRGLMAGSLGHQSDPAGSNFEPEILAAFLNERFSQAGATKLDTDSIAAIGEFMRLECSRPSSLKSGNMPFIKLAAFISALNPDLRCQFLSSTFGIENPDGSAVTENIVNSMPAEIVLETLQDLNQNDVSVPPVIMSLLQKLSSHADKGRNRLISQIQDDELQEKMRTVFKEHASEEFIPDIYQQQLNTLVTENQVRNIPDNALTDLLATVESNIVENRISDIILNLVTSGGDTLHEREFFLQNLSDLFGYFLQIGDYGQLVKMIDRTNDDSFPIDLQYYLRENYARREFLDEILNGLTTWGKPRYNDIREIITKIRSPFIEALLDNLATEDNMSLRRFMMDRLIEMGPMTRVPIAIRLDDDRWFVLRNLIVILRAHSDVSIIPLIRPLTRHSNAKVRQEALYTLVMLHDAASEKQVLRDLDSEDREVQLTAISLAEKSRLPDIHKKLLLLLSRGGLTQLEYETKSAVVKALGELHRPESLPELAKILASSSIFNSKVLNRLKIDIIRTMENFPLQTIAPLLERIAAGRDEIALQAQDTLKNIKAKANER